MRWSGGNYNVVSRPGAQNLDGCRLAAESALPRTHGAGTESWFVRDAALPALRYFDVMGLRVV